MYMGPIPLYLMNLNIKIIINYSIKFRILTTFNILFDKSHNLKPKKTLLHQFINVFQL